MLPGYMNWQRRRKLELAALSIAAFASAYVAQQYPALVLPAGAIASGVAIWQLVVTNDYRKLGFINTGQ